MPRICWPNCARSLAPTEDMPALCTFEATPEVVYGKYLNAETCEEMRKPGRQCGPTGRKFQRAGW